MTDDAGRRIKVISTWMRHYDIIATPRWRCFHVCPLECKMRNSNHIHMCSSYKINIKKHRRKEKGKARKKRKIYSGNSISTFRFRQLIFSQLHIGFKSRKSDPRRDQTTPERRMLSSAKDIWPPLVIVWSAFALGHEDLNICNANVKMCISHDMLRF